MQISYGSEFGRYHVNVARMHQVVYIYIYIYVIFTT